MREYIAFIVVWFIVSELCSIVFAYIKMYGCDDMWKCSEKKCLCMQLITRNIIIIAIFTVLFMVGTFCGSEKAFEHFSFAGTITSIILSVLAIMMTINSEEKNERIKGSIDNALTVIQSSSTMIAEYNEKVERIYSKVDEIKQISTELSKISATNAEIRNYQKEVLRRVEHIDSTFTNQDITDAEITDFGCSNQEENNSEQQGV